jgi:hypothetical protein
VIPLELRQSTRWMVWFNPGDTKIPLDAKTGRGAPGYMDDPSAWSTYEQAMKRAHRLGNKRGIGLIVGYPFIVVDIDDCVVHPGAGALTNRGQAIVRKLPSTYAEFSPSKTGLHFWYRCQDHEYLPDCAKVAFEVYSRRRFMTVTGDVANAAPVAEISRQEALAIFELADPGSVEPKQLRPDEEGYWCDAALEACLKAWKAAIKSFKYENRSGKWAVPCPNYTSHSVKRGELSRDAQVWVQNGWPVFNCFHAHCSEITWRAFADYFDPFRDHFDFDAWQEDALRRLDNEAGK